MTVVSQSTIADFTRCGRKWWFRHYRGLRKRDEYRSPASIGTFVHAALADYYASIDDPFEVIKRMGKESIAEMPDRAEQIADDAVYAGIIVEGYLQWIEETGADAGLEYVEPEREIRVNLTPEIVMLAKLDAKYRRGDWLGFMEHKVVGNFIDLPSYAQQDRQILSYEMVSMIEAAGERKTDGAILNLLRKVKRTASATPPFYDRVEVRHNIVELRNHFRHTLAVAKDIRRAEQRLDAGEDHHRVVAPVPTRDCRYMCSYYDVCRLQDDGSDATWVEESLFEVGDPFERYDLDVGGDA